MLIEQLLLNTGNTVATYRTYFTVDTTVGVNDPAPSLFISSTGLPTGNGNGHITNVETGDGGTASINSFSGIGLAYTVISYTYDSNSGTYSGYFDSQYGLYDIAIHGPITSLTQIPTTIQTFVLISNVVDIDLSYVTNLQAVTLSKFNPSLPFLSTLNITNLLSLGTVQIFNSDLTQLDLSGLSNLSQLIINDSPSLNTFLGKEDCSSLTYLDITNCNFTSVQDFHFLTFVVGSPCSLYISGNPISSGGIDVSDSANGYIYSLESVTNLIASTCSLYHFSNIGQWSVSRPNTHPNLSVSISYQIYKNSSIYDNSNLTITEDYYNQTISGTFGFTDPSYYIPNVFSVGFTVDVGGFGATLPYATSTIGVDTSSITVLVMSSTTQDVQVHLESAGDSFDIYFSISYTIPYITAFLSTLDISNNDFSSGLSLNTFASLGILKINNCNLNETLLSGISSLSELYASYNTFGYLGSALQFNNPVSPLYAPSLQKLVLSHNSLFSMFDTYSGLPGIYYLDLSWNTNLSDLGLYPAPSPGFLYISYLDISHTKLSSSSANGYNDFMNDLSTNSSLMYLYADWSPITVDANTIVSIIASNPNLRVLKASHTNDVSYGMPFLNGIYSHLSSISLHNEIIELDLSYSRVDQVVFDDGATFTNLEIVNISNSLVSDVHLGNASINFPKLVTLNLSHNSITNWTQPTTNGDNINNFQLLQNLILNNNPIDIFNLKSTGDKGVLVNLDLENCTEITEINIGHLGGPITLQNVNMNLNSSVGKTVTFYFENIIDLNSFTLSNTTIVGKNLYVDTNVSLTNTSTFYFGSLLSTFGQGDLTIYISDSNNYGPKSISLYDTQLSQIYVNPSTVMNSFSVDSCATWDAPTLNSSISQIISYLVSASNPGGFINLTNNEYLGTGQKVLSTLESKIDSFLLNSIGITFDTSSAPNYMAYNPNRDVLFTAYSNNKLIATDADTLSVGYGTGYIITGGSFSGGKVIYYKIDSTSEEIALSISSDVVTPILVGYANIGSYSVLGNFTVTDPILDVAYDSYNEIVYLTGNHFLELRDSHANHNIYTLVGTRSTSSKFRFDSNNNRMWATNGFDVEVFFTQSSPPTTIYTGLTNSRQIAFSSISNEMYVGEFPQPSLGVSNVLIFDCATSSYGTLKSTFQIPTNINRMEYNEWLNQIYIIDKNYEMYIYSCDEGILLGPNTNNFSQGIISSGDFVRDIVYNPNIHFRSMWISFDSGGPNSNNILTYDDTVNQILLPVNDLEVLRGLSWNIITDDYPVTSLIDNDVYNYLQESGANGIKQTWAISKLTKLLRGEPYGADNGTIVRTTNRTNTWDNLIALYPYLPLNNTTVVTSVTASMNNYSVNLITPGASTYITYNNPSNLTFDDVGIFGTSGSYGYNSSPLPHITDNLNYGAYYENYSVSEDGLLGAINGSRYDGISMDSTNSKFGMGNTYSTSIAGSGLMSVSRIGLTVSLYINGSMITQSSQVSLGPTTSIYYHALKDSSTGNPTLENTNRIKGFHVGENITSAMQKDLFDAWAYYLNAKIYV
jgi:hypothetical protein